MDESDKYKNELVILLAPIISKEGLTDVTDWIEKNAKEGFNHNGVARSVAFILEATGDFQREELLDKSRYYVKRLPAKSFKHKFPTLYDLVLVIFGAGIGLASGYFQYQLQNTDLTNKVENNTKEIEGLRDSISEIKKQLIQPAPPTNKK